MRKRLILMSGIGAGVIAPIRRIRTEGGVR